MDREEFYLVSDNEYLITVFEQELAFVQSNWFSSGRPTMVVMLTNQMLGALKSNKFQRNSSKRNLFNFMMSLRSGVCGGVRVRLGRLSEMINTACIQSLDFLTSSDQENWHLVLSGGDVPIERSRSNLPAFKPEDMEETTLKRPPSVTRRRQIIRTSSSDPSPVLGGGSKSPLAKPIYKDDYDLNSTTFKLREHVDNENEELESLELESDSPPLTLTLGDPSHVNDAILLLRSCNNLYDQMDILHYLHSCHGPLFHVDGLSSVANLLEEVYVKATNLRQWSLVRQAAGLLRKIVNNLSINIADLLIRQKPVTVGFGDQTYIMTSPMRPSALAEIIYKHSSTDVREAPLVQEVITSLASLVRSHESLFEGIMRIRTHFFIIAMREEISRMKSCNEEIAVEHLMQVIYLILNFCINFM